MQKHSKVMQLDVQMVSSASELECDVSLATKRRPPGSAGEAVEV